jgi:excisionase family DNA binding protein
MKTGRPQTRGCLRNRSGLDAKTKKGGKEMEKSTLSVQELSAQMGISLPKAYELVRTEGFPIIRFGKRILIPVDEFRIWLKEKSQES